jgi:hypothetical protein
MRPGMWRRPHWHRGPWAPRPWFGWRPRRFWGPGYPPGPGPYYGGCLSRAFGCWTLLLGLAGLLALTLTLALLLT